MNKFRNKHMKKRKKMQERERKGSWKISRKEGIMRKQWDERSQIERKRRGQGERATCSHSRSVIYQRFVILWCLYNIDLTATFSICT